MAIEVRWRGIGVTSGVLEPARVDVVIRDFGIDPMLVVAHVQAALSEVGDVTVGPDTAFVSVNSTGVVVLAEDVVDVSAWITRLCAGLETRGVNGTLAAANSRWLPSWAYPQTMWPQPSALVAYRLASPWALQEGGRLGAGWGLESQGTLALTRHASTWLSAVDGETFAIQGPFSMSVDLDDVPELMLYSLRHDQRTRATRATRRPLQSVSVEMSEHGQVSYQHCVAGESAMGHLDHLLTALLLRPDEADWGAVRYTPGPPSNGWRGGQFSRYPSPPHITASTWSRHRHLWSRYVPDAYGIQLLTSDHLARCKDLIGWSVTEVGEHRWLVQAADLSQWFGPTTSDDMVSGGWPAADVLDQARSDFGHMILNQMTAEANPPLNA